MRHPLHIILKRWLDSEPVSLDAQPREFWQIVPWPLHERAAGDPSGRAAPASRRDGDYSESKSPN